MMHYLIGWLGTAFAFLAIDSVWLSQMTARFYRPAMGELFADKPRLTAAAAFYLLYVTGVFALAVLPAFRDGNILRAAILGAAIGLMAYGTYDLTNHATLKQWPLRLTLVDMTWGTALTSLAACAGYWSMLAVQGEG